MNKEARECSAHVTLYVEGIFNSDLCLVVREQRGSAGRKKRDTFQSTGKKYVVQQIMKYMEENYREKISLEQIAAKYVFKLPFISQKFLKVKREIPLSITIRLAWKKQKKF